MDSSTELTEKDLESWNLLEGFETALQEVLSEESLPSTFDDPRRKLLYGRYLSLFLFGLFNPMVASMRALCSVSRLERVQKEICGARVGLGSFSEMQHVVDPALLRKVFHRLVQKTRSTHKGDTRLAHLNLIAQDGSLWSALPRMGWAEYGVGCKGEAHGVRLHLRFHLVENKPVDGCIDKGNSCERKALRKMLTAQQINVADRYYGKDYRLLRQIQEADAFFVFRISEHAVINLEEELPLSPAEKAAGVVRHAWVTLGANQKSIRLRVVEIRNAGQHLLLATNLPVELASAELVGLIYRARWGIELFFRWIKCILGCRHFFAESPPGVAIQLYLALIAALLFQYYTGRRPTKRIMELLQFYHMGWASLEELLKLLRVEMAKGKPAAKA